MDDECAAALNSLALDHMDVFWLSAVERFMFNEPIKDSRTWQEYCWTCASNFAHWLLPHSEITYLDSDCWFASDPEAVFAEIGERSIGIVPHRFPPERKHMEVNGKFNVSWVTFRGAVGFKCLEKWARQCREKCSAKEGCGDQKYLDAWPTDYPGEVCEIQNIGVGTAPWNVSQYRVVDGPWGVRLNGQPLIFFHYHEYQHNQRLTNYKLRKEDRDLIYAPYIEAVEAAKARVESLMMEAIQ